MNKLYTYLLPLSAGGIGLLFTPLSENSVVSYITLGVAVILGMVGIQGLVKEKQQKNDTFHQSLLALEKAAIAADSAIAGKLQLQIDAIESNSNAITRALSAGMEGTKAQNEANQQHLTKQLTNLMSQLENTAQQMISIATVERTQLQQATQALQDKVEDGNAVVENVSIIMIQELKLISKHLEELNTIQAAMQNELYSLQDSVTTNQQDTIDATRNVEVQIEKLTAIQQIVQTQLETSATTHEQVIGKISEEFAEVSRNLDASNEKVLKKITAYYEKADAQVTSATAIVEKTEHIQEELAKANELTATTVTKQLQELQGLNKTLVQGIAQIADSKSAERQQLLKIQKELIKEYSR